jgi:hypothetical protein
VQVRWRGLPGVVGVVIHTRHSDKLRRGDGGAWYAFVRFDAWDVDPVRIPVAELVAL